MFAKFVCLKLFQMTIERQPLRTTLTSGKISLELERRVLTTI